MAERGAAAPGTLSEADVLAAMKEKGLLDSLLGRLAITPSPPTPTTRSGAPPVHYSQAPQRTKPSVSPQPNPSTAISSPFAHHTGPHLHVHLSGARAFLDVVGDAGSSSKAAFFVAHLILPTGPPGTPSQRLSSSPVPAEVDPSFDDAFLFALPAIPTTSSDASSTADLLAATRPLKLLISQIGPGGTDPSLVASALIDWTPALNASPSSSSASITLGPIGPDARSAVSAGMIHVRIDIIPPSDKTTLPPLPDGGLALGNAAKASSNASAEADKEFYIVAKEWWHSYLSIRASHARRPVRLFATGLDGVSRPIQSLMSPIRLADQLASPQAAARFVSLIPFQHQQAVGGGTNDVWADPASFLAAGSGDIHDHALLLMLLLQAFGLNAYLASGSTAKGPHTWVVTLDDTTVSPPTVSFWEPLTGARYNHVQHAPPSAVNHPYTHLWSLANRTSLYAVAAADDSVSRISFELANQAAWKALPAGPSSALARTLRGSLAPPVVLRSPDYSRAAADAARLESALEALITSARASSKRATAWETADTGPMRDIVSMALASYEGERSTGVPASSTDFAAAVKRAVPSSYTFKGFPIQFSHQDASRILAAIQRAPMGRDILASVGDSVRFCCRVRIFPYPEGISAVWVMLVVKYRPL